jgi:hypothetical protein
VNRHRWHYYKRVKQRLRQCQVRLRFRRQSEDTEAWALPVQLRFHRQSEDTEAWALPVQLRFHRQSEDTEAWALPVQLRFHRQSEDTEAWVLPTRLQGFPWFLKQIVTRMKRLQRQQHYSNVAAD